MIKSGFKTDVGRRRERNEDALLLLPKENLFAVADGVGGQNCGDFASRKAVNGIEEFLYANPVDNAGALEGKYRKNWFKSYFLRCFQKINNDILGAAARDPQKKGMATTAVVCYIENGKDLYVTNIGDSRAYIIRDEEISQLTEDHTFVNSLINSGALTKSEARTHPKKNVITRALGVEYNIEPDFYLYNLDPGDLVILCTDGLSGELSDAEICGIALSDPDLNIKCKKLVNAANEKGGGDNITVICLEI
ncbi:MAG: Stp1/IreP family PP2C-type Ser/Thr phosphatase [Clostridiales Family XIII bacterium]|jgi:protein phosphatase|nr:Stp1/IreP family PP2C-type Ser/Thr phosphatase [Clostridiales Family XIII bacterium]